MLISVHNRCDNPGKQRSHAADPEVTGGHPDLVFVKIFLPSFCVHLPLNSSEATPPPLILTVPTASSPLHAALLSRQHFNKQSPGNKMLLNGCVLLAGSEQAVYRGACQLLPLGCCSMWKQWRESAFDASPTWFSHSVLLFSLWWSSVKCSSATGGRLINTHAGEEGRRTHTVNSPELSAHISVRTCSTQPFFFSPLPQWEKKCSWGLSKILLWNSKFYVS